RHNHWAWSSRGRRWRALERQSVSATSVPTRLRAQRKRRTNLTAVSLMSTPRLPPVRSKGESVWRSLVAPGLEGLRLSRNGVRVLHNRLTSCRRGRKVRQGRAGHQARTGHTTLTPHAGPSDTLPRRPTLGERHPRSSRQPSSRGSDNRHGGWGVRPHDFQGKTTYNGTTDAGQTTHHSMMALTHALTLGRPP